MRGILVSKCPCMDLRVRLISIKDIVCARLFSLELPMAEISIGGEYDI